MSRFHEVIREVRERAGISAFKLARLANMNSSYIYRMQRPGGQIPRRELLDSIISALGLAPFEADRLLVSAGYCPKAVSRLDSWDETLSIVAQVLGDGSLSDEEREEFRQIIRAVASRWIPNE